MHPRQLPDSTTHERRRSLLSTADRLVFSYRHKPTSAGDRAHRQDSPSCKRPRPILGPPARSPSSRPDRQPRTLRDRCGGRQEPLNRSGRRQDRPITPAAQITEFAVRPWQRAAPDRPTSRRQPLVHRERPRQDRGQNRRQITHSQAPNKQCRAHPPHHRSRCNAASSISRPHFEDPSTLTRRSKTPACTSATRGRTHTVNPRGWRFG
jgi:hypothetical protein